MFYAFNPKTLRIRVADTKSKLGKSLSTMIFDNEEEFITFIDSYLEDLSKELEPHIQAFKEIQEKLTNITTQLQAIRTSNDKR